MPHAQGQANVFGPANMSLIPELAVPDATVAQFQMACFNPTIPGLLRSPCTRHLHAA